MSGDARVALPLFQQECGGSTPTSPLHRFSDRIVMPIFYSENIRFIPKSPKQMKIIRIYQDKAIHLNRVWHSTQPEMTNYWYSRCWGAVFDNTYFAVMIWTMPVARKLNFSGKYELRRFAISDDAPPNTASWMLSKMVKIIKSTNNFPCPITTLISYQDTSLHPNGTIYKASGWEPIYQKKGDGKGWGNGWFSRKRKGTQAIGDKIRWEKEISSHPVHTLKNCNGDKSTRYGG